MSRSVPLLPEPVRETLLRLDAPVRLVGRGVLDLLYGRRPACFEAESAIGRATLLARMPRAVPTGVHSGRITLPTKAGPIDLRPDTVSARPAPFRLLELCLDPRTARVEASHDTWRDLDAGTLSPGSAPRSEDDARFALDAARLIADYDFSPTATLLERSRAAGSEIDSRLRTRLRRQLRSILLAPHARAGLRWLRETGVESEWLPHARSEAPELVTAVPPRLALRIAAWSIDAEARSLLRALHFGHAFSSRVYRLLEWHPIDRHLDPQREGHVRRWLKKTHDEEIADCIALASAEATLLDRRGKREDAREIRRRLDALTNTMARVREAAARRRADRPLALSGEEVMAQLRCAPGPRVGRALAHLSRIVADDPASNAPASLRARLDDWARAHPEEEAG